jgi:hypothetical protein
MAAIKMFISITYSAVPILRVFFSSKPVRCSQGRFYFGCKIQLRCALLCARVSARHYCRVEPRFAKASHHEQIGSRTNFPKKNSRVTNGVSRNEHASRQQRLAISWEYRRKSVSCCVTFVQYTSLLEFVVRSFKFYCVLWFFI